VTEKRVQTVDDDPQVRSQLSALLALRGCRVRTARTGAEALASLDAFRPTFVLLEMRLPVMDGWALVRELRARHDEVPLVVMGPESEAKSWAEQVAAVGFLTKPVQVSSLLACVQVPEQDSSTYAAYAERTTVNHSSLLKPCRMRCSG
jgi:two-component system, OmpR family, response regulator